MEGGRRGGPGGRSTRSAVGYPLSRVRRTTTGDDLVGDLAEMCDYVCDALADATTALLDVDLQLAEAVITGDLRVVQLYARAEDSAAELLALQAPVTTDLRVVVAATTVPATSHAWAT